jgi:hypothetical protein
MELKDEDFNFNGDGVKLRVSELPWAIEGRGSVRKPMSPWWWRWTGA